MYGVLGTMEQKTRVTRLIANFLKTNPGVTAELGYTNRLVHVIQEGYDAGVVAGDITDDTVVARPSGPSGVISIP